MWRDEETTPERASSSSGLVQALGEAGSEPAFASDDAIAAAEANDAVVDRDGLDFVRPQDLLGPMRGAGTTAAPPERQLPEPTMTSRVTAQLNQLPLRPSMTTLLAASGLAAGIGMGILLRQQRSARERARRHARSATRGAKRQTQQAAHGMQDTLRAATGQTQAATVTAAAGARTAGKQAKRTAMRVARRGRWFRRGLLIGAALSILFAPERGAELREQIASTIESWRSRSA
jgi:hypothetical protein